MRVVAGCYRGNLRCGLAYCFEEVRAEKPKILVRFMQAHSAISLMAMDCIASNKCPLTLPHSRPFVRYGIMLAGGGYVRVSHFDSKHIRLSRPAAGHRQRGHQGSAVPAGLRGSTL